MRILALDSALGRCTAALVVDGDLVREAHEDAAPDPASMLVRLAGAMLGRDGTAGLDAIAAVVGPGSFTGLRGCLALAHGLALGSGLPIIGVTVTEALASALPRLGHRRLWVALHGRRGLVHLDTGTGPVTCRIDDPPPPTGPVAVAGDAAIAIAARLAARGDDVMLTDARRPSGRHIALIAQRRLAGALPPLAGVPLYAEPPQVRLPATGIRPPPHGAS